MVLNLTEKYTSKTIAGVSFLIVTVLLLINHFWGFFGHFGCDDMSYAGIMNSVLEGKFTIGYDHANYRWVLIFLTALSYKIFGICDQSSALMPLLFTLGTAWLVGQCNRGRWSSALAIMLFGLHSFILYYSDKIFPDIYIAFFFMAAVYIVFLQRKNATQPFRQGLILALVLFLAILSKETIILTIPVFVYLGLADVIQKRNASFWTVSIVSLIIIMLIYLVFIKMQTGHLLQRYYAIKAQSYFNPCSYDQLPIAETVRRITSSLWLVFVRSGLFWLLIFGMISLVGRPLRSLLSVSSPEDFFPMVFILTALCCDLMTTSITHYVPMCDDPRHFLFLVPLAAIAAADGMIRFFSSPVQYIWLIICMYLAFYLSHSHSYENAYIVYLPWVAVMTFGLLSVWLLKLFGKDIEVKRKAKVMINIVLALSVSCIVLSQPIQGFLYARSMGYRFQKRLVMKNIRNVKENTIVITNFVERNFGPYYMSYDTSHVIFRSFQDIKAAGLPRDRKIYLLVDGYSSTVGSQRWEDMPEYARHNSKYTLIDRIHGAELYELRYEDVKP